MENKHVANASCTYVIKGFLSAMNTKLIPQIIFLMGTPSLKAPQPICHSLQPNRFNKVKANQNGFFWMLEK
jgi:hypothetical protein